MVKIDNIEYANIQAFTESPRNINNMLGSPIVIAVIEAEKGNLQPLKEMYGKFTSDLIKGYYKLGGWQFHLRKYCKRYLVKHKYEDIWREYYTPNKTCLYNVVGRSNIDEIIEIKS